MSNLADAEWRTDALGADRTNDRPTLADVADQWTHCYCGRAVPWYATCQHGEAA
jgi:hypothetical protein